MYRSIFKNIEWSESSVKKNFYLNLLDGAVFAFGMNFVSLTTILPVYAKKIGGSNISVGLIPVLWTLGVNFPQIFIAGYAGGVEKKKNLVLFTAVLQRLPWLILGLLALFVIENLPADYALLLFFAGFMLAAAGTGINLPAWFDLTAKVTPVKLRGRLFAFRVTLGALLGMFAGYAAERLLGKVGYPLDFSLLFFAGFTFMAISYIFLLNIEERTANTDTTTVNYIRFLRGLPGLIKREVNYRNFLISDALLIVALMSNAFYAVYAIEKFGLPESRAGIFTIVMMFSMVVGSLVFGTLADKLGHKVNLFSGALFTMAASLLAVFAPGEYFYYPVFVFAAFTVALSQVSRLSIIAEVCGEKERSTYVALTNLVSVPFTLSGVLGGWIANRWGFPPVFYAAAFFAGSSALWMLFKVKEPRNNNSFPGK